MDESVYSGLVGLGMTIAVCACGVFYWTCFNTNIDQQRQRRQEQNKQRMQYIRRVQRYRARQHLRVMGNEDEDNSSDEESDDDDTPKWADLEALARYMIGFNGPEEVAPEEEEEEEEQPVLVVQEQEDEFQEGIALAIAA